MRTLLILFLLILSNSMFAQEIPLEYEPSASYPFGRLNPDAPMETGDYGKLIGLCDCKRVIRNPDQTWSDTTAMIWKWKYIMNGYAVQDEVFREGNLYAGGVRQFNVDSAQWVVSYFSQPAVPWVPGVWHGGTQENQDIVLFKDQKAPNGTDGFYKITFTNISKDKFDWIGEWVNVGETFKLPTMMIYCQKRKM